MSKQHAIFRCSECEATSAKWSGRCPACRAWNTLVESAPPARGSGAGAGSAGGLAEGGLGTGEPPLPLAEVTGDEWQAAPTGIAELDRVLGGGLVPGSVTLLGGEPGVGKSTLLIQLAAARAQRGERVLYVSGEESRQQVRLRAARLGLGESPIWLVSESSVESVAAHVDDLAPSLLLVDSIQSMGLAEVGSSPGSVGQVRACAARFVQLAKARGMATVLVGHVTKDGGLAGPRVLEHVVDTVLAFGGERHHALRLLRATKHRFGSTAELGLFEMGERGLVGIPDPSVLFLADRQAGVAGSVVAPMLDGQRALLVEVQALAVPTRLPSPRRSAQGLESSRLAVLLAVLERRLEVPLSQLDLYALAAGGVRVTEPGADLALALAVMSSVQERAVPADVVAVGEVGLAGELRQVGQMGRRLSEAARMGFRGALVPASAPDPPAGLALHRCATLAEAAAAVGLGSARPRAAVALAG